MPNTNSDTVDTQYYPLRKISNTDSINIIIKDTLSEKTGIEYHLIADNASFVDDLGIDSLDFIEIIMELEKKFKIKITDEESEKLRTVANIIQLIKQKI
jgi:acyl carrier protein